MKKTLFVLAAAAAMLSANVLAARVQAPQNAMAADLPACAQPIYPATALAQRAEGKTTVEVQIGTTGLVTDARVAVSSGRPDLDQAALDSIRRCVFHAVLATGQAPTGWLKTQYVWKTDGAKKTEAQDQSLYASTTERAAAGDPVAQNRLGAWYEHGTYVKADLAQAAAWYLPAAEAGNAIAQNNLGVLYVRGAGVPRDPKQAVYWYARAAEQGHAWAQANLAWAYQYGTAGELDAGKALYWLTKSASSGLAAAQVRLGLLLMQRAATDDERGVAAAWFARASAQDYPQGLYYEGRSFELGIGNVHDDGKAAGLYRRALGRSDGRAETVLGSLIEAGRGGTAEPDEAARLYLKAMQARYPAAFYRYGLFLEQQGDGDLAAAVFRQGAELGSCDAVVKYVQVRKAPVPTTAPVLPETDWQQRATACAAHPTLPAQL